MIKISVVIPIYNTPVKLIKRCISSLEKQSYPYGEIIMVDDGSQKEIADFLDGVARRLFSCRIIHTKNQGVSEARNTGVIEATGDYIMFVDADDIVAPYMLEEASDAITATGADICYGMIQYLQDKEKILCKKLDKALIKTIEKKEQKMKLLRHLIALGEPDYKMGRCYLSRGPYARLVKRKLALDVPFIKRLKIGEDSLWNLQIAKKAEKISVVYSCWYSYVKYNESATNRFRKDYEQFVLLMEMLQKEMGENVVYRLALMERNIDIFFEYINSCYAHEKYLEFSCDPDIECRKFVEKYNYFLKCNIRDFFCMHNKSILKFLILKSIYPIKFYKTLKRVENYLKTI